MDIFVMRRRKLLALTGTATAGGLAGCSDLEEIADAVDDTDSGDGGDDRRQDDEAGEEDETEDQGRSGGAEGLGVTGVLDRLPAPEVVGSPEPYPFSVSSPSSIDEANDLLDDRRLTTLLQRSESSQIDSVVDFWNVETHVAGAELSFLVGRFDRGDVWRRVSYNDVDHVEDHGGFALLSDGDVAIAIEGEGPLDAEEAPPTIDELVLSDHGTDPVGRLRAGLDVRAGDADRYADTNPEVRDVLSGTGVETLTGVETYEPLGGDERPSNPTEYTSAPVGAGPVDAELTDDPTEFDGQEFSFIDRYGFGANAGDVITIEVQADTDSQIGIILYAGDGTDIVDDGGGPGGGTLTTELPQDGGYNFIIVDYDRLEASDAPPVPYTLDIEIEGADIGGPESGVFESEVGRGTSLSLGPEMATKRWVRVFENGGDVLEDDIQTWIDANDGPNEQFGTVDSVDISIQGAQVVVEGTVPTSEIEPDAL